MMTRALLAAILVGLFSGLVMTAVQYWRVVPLIVAAEQYEDKESGEHDHSAISKPVPSMLSVVGSAEAHNGDDVAKMIGAGRLGGTVLANLVTGAGFALLLLSASVLLNKPVTFANAAIWGAMAWLALHFLPAIGLPPELPGFPAADLQSRQIWWVATIALSAVGLALLMLRDGTVAKLGGLALIALPHIFGAPQPADISSAVPALIAAEYSVAALAASLIGWFVIAFGLGIANEQIEAKAA